MTPPTAAGTESRVASVSQRSSNGLSCHYTTTGLKELRSEQTILIVLQRWCIIFSLSSTDIPPCQFTWSALSEEGICNKVTCLVECLSQHVLSSSIQQLKKTTCDKHVLSVCRVSLPIMRVPAKVKGLSHQTKSREFAQERMVVGLDSSPVGELASCICLLSNFERHKLGPVFHESPGSISRFAEACRLIDALSMSLTWGERKYYATLQFDGSHSSIGFTLYLPASLLNRPMWMSFRRIHNATRN